MESRNLEKAMEVFGALLTGEEISLGRGRNAALYEAYNQNAQVGELVDRMLSKLNLRLYEYNYSLYLTAGTQNKVFGYSNDELKRMMGLRLNRELYLCYYIIYSVMQHFYSDSATYTFVEYVRTEELVTSVDMSLSNLIDHLQAYVGDEAAENSFKAIAAVWDELPVMSNEETALRAGRGSRIGYVKLTFNFLIGQGLLVENGEKYYPTDRFHGMVRCYFEQERGRLYSIMKAQAGGEEQQDATH